MSNIQHCVSVSVAPAASSSPLLPSMEKAYGWDLDSGQSGQLSWEEHSLKTEAPQRVNVTPVDARYSLLVTLLGSNWYCEQALRLGLGPGSAESEEEDTYHILFKTFLPRK